MLRTRVACLAPTLAALFLSLVCECSLLGQEQVQVRLRSQIITSESITTLVEFADLSGGSSNARVEMGKLDFTVETGADASISKNEAVARLLLAGYLKEQFSVIGPEKTLLFQPGIALDSSMFSAAISRHVALAFGIPNEDVVVEIAKLPEMQPVPAGVPIEIRPLDHADQLIGNRSVTLGVFQGTQLLQQVRVVAKTRYLRDVLVARIPVEKGEQLTPSNSFMKKTQFDRVVRAQLIDSSAHGKTTARRLRGQQMIRATDVRNEKLNANREIMIRSRALVTAVAKKGTLQVTMSGLEAMKAGKLGETIPVKNLATKKVIYGRVVDVNVIEVSF